MQLEKYSSFIRLGVRSIAFCAMVLIHSQYALSGLVTPLSLSVESHGAVATKGGTLKPNGGEATEVFNTQKHLIHNATRTDVPSSRAELSTQSKTTNNNKSRKQSKSEDLTQPNPEIENPFFSPSARNLSKSDLQWHALNIIQHDSRLRTSLCGMASEKKSHFPTPIHPEPPEAKAFISAIQQANNENRSNWALEYALSTHTSKDYDPELRNMILKRLLRIQKQGAPVPAVIHAIASGKNSLTEGESKTAKEIIEKAKMGEIPLTEKTSIPGIAPIPATRTEVHKELEETLYVGKIISAQRLGGKNKNGIWVAKLKNEKTGQTIDAIVKPRAPGDGGGWNKVAKEYTAYYLGLNVLQMDYVPPAAYRRNFELKDSKTGESISIKEGSVALKVPNAEALVDVAPHKWGIEEKALISDHRIVRVLLGDPDGHQDNVLYGTHWNSEKKEAAPVFIDFGASFISRSVMKQAWIVKGQLDMNYYSEHAGVFRSNVDSIRKKTYDRLKSIQKMALEGKSGDLFKDLKGRDFLNSKEKALFLERVNHVVSHFDYLISKNGEGVVLDQ